MKTPSCSSAPVLDHLDLLLPSPGTAFSIYPNAMSHNICTYQSTNEMSKTQMIGVQIKLGGSLIERDKAGQAYIPRYLSGTLGMD